MVGLTDKELQYMRESIGQLLPDTATIVTITQSPDGQGGQTDTRSTSSAYAFRLDMESGSEMTSGGALLPFTKYKGSLPYDTVVTNGSELVHNSVTYTVTSVNANQSWIAVKRVDLEKVA